MTARARRHRGLSVSVRLVVAVCVATAGLAIGPGRSLAVDYRLEIVAGSFTTRVGDPVILTVSTPNVTEVEAMLTDPATTAVAQVSEPIDTRAGVEAIVAGADFVAEGELAVDGPVFRRATFGDLPAYQLVLPTADSSRGAALPIAGAGLRAMRVTLTAPSGLVARSTSFLNVVSGGTYAPLPVYFFANVDGAPTLQPDGSTVVGDAERVRLGNLRDLLFRKPPGVPIGVRLRPELIDGLSRSPAEGDDRLLAELVERLSDNDLLVGTFRPTDVASYASAGLKEQFEAQLLRGETVVDDVNGPDLTTRSVWLTEEPINAAGVDLLRGFGVTNLVATGDAALSLGPDVDPSRPYALRTETNGLVVSFADARYARLLDQPTGTAHESAVALAAELVAQREEIADSPVGPVALVSRHVVLAAASGAPNEPLISTILLRLLRGSPQIALRRATALAPTLEGLARLDPPVTPVADVRAITARAADVIGAVESVRDVLVTNPGVVERWIEIVDVANDTSIGEARRDEYLAAVVERVESVRSAVRLPTSSFTFGSRESDLRISLTNTSDLAVSLRLRMTSPTGKIAFSPPLVDVVLAAGAQEELVITAQARSNGLIPVEMVLTSPNGTVLDVAEVRIRVNAIAALGRGVSALFLVLLGAWWIAHARRNARRRAMERHSVLRSQP